MEDNLMKEIERLQYVLNRTTPGTAEYEAINNDLLKLMRVNLDIAKADLDDFDKRKKIEIADRDSKANIKKEEQKWYQKIDVNTVISVGASILLTVFVTKHEFIHPISGKGFGTIPRIKIR